MKRVLSVLLALVLVFSLVACDKPAETQKETPAGKATGKIHVVSREDGSGTRGAFVEIVGVVDADGNDLTVQTATIQNGTGKVIETVASDASAIGYVSLGSVDSNLKALSVDGVAATAENVLSGEYPIQRPLNIAYKPGSLSPLAQDFVNFIMSAEGQALAVEKGFVQVDPNAAPYEKGEFEAGQINISGSTSVEPFVTRAAEAYRELHGDVQIVVNATGSSAGVKDAIAGVVDFGMASRDLKEDELKEVEGKVIAKDGIAVVVAKSNPTTNISLESVKKIFLGEITEWEQAQ